MVRSKWIIFYMIFYMILGFVLLFLNHDLSKTIITLLNIILSLTPLIGTVFGVMVFYSSSEFTELLLSQPIKRSSIFLGQYLGLAVSLSLSLILGIGIPFLFFGLINSLETLNFIFLIISGVFLSFIFTAFSFIICLKNENRIKGFGYSILIWLLFSIIYDGFILILLMIFHEYPLEKFAILVSFLNPIDLSRIMILLKLDISALLGYTGAVFSKFFGGTMGLALSISFLILWIVVPIMYILTIAKNKDF